MVMRRARYRIAGALLLSTLLLSMAEAAWAAACEPAMAEMPESAMGWMAGMAEMPAGHECPPGHGHNHNGTGETDANCPFAPAGGLGCAASASLPAGGTDVTVPAPMKTLRHVGTAVIAHPLHAHPIFHPPKA
jgi:hypothetical protein